MTSQRDKQLFEKEMKQLQVKEGLERLKKPEDAPSSLMQERREKLRKEKMLKVFEQEVIEKPKPRMKEIVEERSPEQSPPR